MQFTEPRMFSGRTHSAVKLQKESLEHLGGPLRAGRMSDRRVDAPGSGPCSATFLAISLTFEGVPFEPGPQALNREWGETGIF